MSHEPSLGRHSVNLKGAVAATRVNDVMRACCPGGGHRRAQDGDVPTCDLPEACPSEECALAFLTLMDDCQLWMWLRAAVRLAAASVACGTTSSCTISSHAHGSAL